jgi:hypothetical protein
MPRIPPAINSFISIPSKGLAAIGVSPFPLDPLGPTGEGSRPRTHLSNAMATACQNNSLLTSFFAPQKRSIQLRGADDVRRNQNSRNSAYSSSIMI